MARRLGMWRGALAVLIVAAPPSALTPLAAAQSYLEGIDVSRWQPDVNWRTMARSGVDFAFAKATEGVDFIDVEFHDNMNGARESGVPIGPYHFARPDSFEDNPLDAANEANDFVDAIEPYYTQYPGEYLRPVLDVETLPDVADQRGFLTDWIHNFAEVVEERLGVSPIIYANSNYATNYFESSIAQYDLWLARWTYTTSSPPTGSNLGVWNDWEFWQWTDSWSIGGLSPVDGNVFEGTTDDLAAYLVGAEELAGDYNGDGVVDAADYSVWRDAYGSATDLAADGDGDGRIDADDYQVWRDAFGQSDASSVAAVPEPTAVAGLLSLSALALVGRYRR